MMHGDSRVMVVVCLATTSLPAPCLSTSTFPGSREEPFFMAAMGHEKAICLCTRPGWVIINPLPIGRCHVCL